MQIEENGRGTLRNNLSGKLAYYSFFPTPLQSLRQLNLTEETYRTLSACSRKLGELEGMLYFVPNADMYLTMYVRKEALLSSQIEGTRCTFDDLLSPSQTQLHHKDVADVVNYVRAVDRGVELLKKMPLCTRLLRQVHAVLLDGARNGEESRRAAPSQNWIGPSGCTIATASFVPPNIEDLSNTLQDLERFINEPQVEMDPIVRAALVHYQFETAHPFLDGNGRLGRLLITLMLINDGVLHSCLFYPSFQFKKNRSEYYRQLTSVRERGTYEEWIEFFCNSLLESAKDSVGSLKKPLLTSITVPQQPLPKISEGLLQTGKGCWAFLKSTPSSTPHSSLPNSISAGVPRARSSNHLKNWVSSVRSTSQDRDTGSTGMKSILRFSGKTPSRLDRHRSPGKLKRAWIISHFEPAHRPKPGDYPRSFLSSHL